MVEMSRFGSRAEVMHGKAKMTRGGLKKNDLMYNKRKRIVSRKQHRRAKRENRLFKLGFRPTKGKFTLMKKGKMNKTRSKK
tara:strand:+ start:52 stop:294 length:243 start_codon:yes stop_codon:yes gene_type:complete